MSVLRTIIPILVAVVAIIAAVTDWRWRRIPNWVTVPGLLLGIAVNTIAQGWPGARESLLGAGLGLLVLFPFVLIRALGAGDWKLVGAIGAFVGPGSLISVLVTALLVAGAMALVLVVYKGRFKQMLSNIWKIVFSMLTGHPGTAEVSLDNPESLKIPFGVAVAVAVVVFVGMRFATQFS